MRIWRWSPLLRLLLPVRSQVSIQAANIDQLLMVMMVCIEPSPLDSRCSHHLVSGTSYCLHNKRHFIFVFTFGFVLSNRRFQASVVLYLYSVHFCLAFVTVKSSKQKQTESEGRWKNYEKVGKNRWRAHTTTAPDANIRNHSTRDWRTLLGGRLSWQQQAATNEQPRKKQNNITLYRHRICICTVMHTQVEAESIFIVMAAAAAGL